MFRFLVLFLIPFYFLFFPGSAVSQGLLWPDGVEPGSASECEAPAGSRCWWVHSDAPAGGDGSYSSPFNSFETVAGWQTGANYNAGLIRSGDYLYVRGYFDANNHSESSYSMRIYLGRGFQGGSASAPTVIKSWRGYPRAVFDGRHWLDDLVKVRALSDDHNHGVRIQNIEFRRAGGRAIDIGAYVRSAELLSVEVRDGIGNGNSGEGGGVLFRAQTTEHVYSVRHSRFQNNRVNQFGSVNNIGAVSILSSPEADPDSRVTIEFTEFQDEVNAVRHKHSGVVQTIARNNSISNSERAFYIRSHKNTIYSNILSGVSTALYLEPENQTAPIQAAFYSNRVYGVERLINPGYGGSAFPIFPHLYSNTVVNLAAADYLGSDTDGDGLSDSVELNLGTNMFVADSDGDGVPDGIESADETDPSNASSARTPLPTTLCTEWNGFLNPMWNILELVNVSSDVLSMSVKLFSREGVLTDVVPLSLAAGAQYDLLVHDLPGRKENSYGLICVEHDNAPGALDGRMVYYRGAIDSGQISSHEFAFGMDLSAGRSGSQYVGYNTFHPSFAAGDTDNLVVNWIQLMNLSPEPGSGSLRYYSETGQLISSDSMTLQPGERFDFPGHLVGMNRIGLVEWRPTNPEHIFQLRNVRYLYNNPFAVENFDTAFQLEGSRGNTEPLVVPVTTEDRSAVLELANPDSYSRVYEVVVTDYNSQFLYGEQVSLGPKSVRHIVLDEILGAGHIGVARVRPVDGGTAHVVAMHYSRKASDGGIWSMYGLQAREPLGSLIKSSYNLFLDQEAELWIINEDETHQVVHFSMVRSDGTSVVSNEELFVPGQGMRRLRLNDFESANVYGVLTLIPERANRVAAWVTRKKDGNYIFPSAAR